MRCVDGRARVPGARTNSGCRSPNRRHRARRAGAGRRRRARDRDIARREYQPDGVERERAVLAGGSDAGRLHAARVGVGFPGAGRDRRCDDRDDADRRGPSQTRRLRRAARRDGDALGTAHHQRAGQHQHRIQRADRAISRGRRRRRAAAGADVQPVPADQQHRGEPDGAGRLAARHRAERREPHARAARRRSVQRSVRRLGLLDARADDERRAHRDHRRRHLEPVRQLRDGRGHQHRDEPSDAAFDHLQAAVRQPLDAEDGFVCQRRVGQVRRHLRRDQPADRRLHHRRRGRARRDRQRGERRISELQREDRLQPERSRQPVLPRGRVRRRPEQRQDRRGQRHELEVR